MHNRWRAQINQLVHFFILKPEKAVTCCTVYYTCFYWCTHTNFLMRQTKVPLDSFNWSLPATNSRIASCLWTTAITLCLRAGVSPRKVPYKYDPDSKRCSHESLQDHINSDFIVNLVTRAHGARTKLLGGCMDMMAPTALFAAPHEVSL